MSSTTSPFSQGFQSCLEPLLLGNTKNCLIEKDCESKSNWKKAEPSIGSLSIKSLEMCTESLGNETGTCIDSNIDDFSQYTMKKQSHPSVTKELKTREFSRKVKHMSNNFPPPLTSISRNDGVQVKTHREEGRLVIKAFIFSSCSSYFQAERENGRLRLSLLKDGYIESDHELDANEEEEEEEEEEKVNETEESENEAEFNGCLWGEEQFKEDEGKIGCKIGSGEWPSLPFCVPIS